MTIGFEPQPDAPWEEIRSTFLQECLRHGVMTNGVLLASYGHDDEAVEETLERMGAALASTRERLDGRDGTGRFRPTGGSPFGPRVLEASGFLDVVELAGNELRLEGQLGLSGRAPEAVELVRPDGEVERPDIVVGSGRHGEASARFTSRLDAGALATDHGLELTLRATGPDGTTFTCPVVLSDLRPGDRRGPFPLVDGVLYV